MSWRRGGAAGNDPAGVDPADAAFHHHVYVVELDPAVLDLRLFHRANPDRDPARPLVYVGMTGTSPEERFAQHRAGVKAGRGIVRRFGVRLLPELYAHLNPLPYAAAAEMERDLAEELRGEGFGVWQG